MSDAGTGALPGPAGAAMSWPSETGPLGWARRLLQRRLVRFLLVGGFNTVFGFGLFAALQLTLGERVHYLVLVVVSTVVSVLEAYVVQRWLVWRVHGRWWRELLRFSSVYAGGLGVNLVLLPLLVEVAGMPVLLSQGIVTAVNALGTFAVHRSFTFRRRGEAA
jgi:putative flippase GtrA